MSLQRDYEENFSLPEYSYEEDEGQVFEEKVTPEKLSHKRQIRKLLEERLERKRLKEQFDELDGEFDWDELNR